jgi:hypothetical protein
LRYAGQTGASNVNGFAAFPTQDAGLNAAKNQFSIDAGRGINTLTGLISSWAPKNENDTAAYIKTVAGATGIDPNAKIDLTDPQVQAKLMPAMSLVENGSVVGKPSTPEAPPTGAGGVQPAPQQVLDGQPGQLPGQGLSQPNYALPYPDATKPNKSSALLALASGLLAGPTLSTGLSKGLQGMLGEGQQDRAAQMQANGQALQVHQLGVSNDYKNAMLGNAVNRTGIQQQNANTGVGRMGIQQQNADTAGSRLKVAQDALAGRLSPTTQAALSQGKTAAVSAQKDIDATIAGQPQDEQGLADINNAQTLITQKPELMGPTLASRWSRFAAETGLSGDAADLNALQKMTADQRNTALSSLTNGHVGAIRSNAELTNLSKAVADVGTSPAAAQFILNMQKTQLQGRQAWRQELTDRYQTDPDSITGRQYNVTKQQFYDDYYKSNPLPDYKSPSAQSGPVGNAPPPGAGSPPVKGVSNGVQWSFTPSTQ